MHFTGSDKRVIVRVKKRNRQVQLTVTDTGCGIAPEDIPLVWDRYYKASRTNKRSAVGSGIGLSIVKNILILHHAAYGIDSAPGNGSTFWFTLHEAQQ